MKIRRALSIAVFLALIGSGVCLAAPPQKLYSRFNPDGPPLWVAAEVAVTEDGEMDWSIFRPPQREGIQEFLGTEQYEKDGCIDLLLQPMLVDTRPNGTLDDLIENSFAIYDGYVREITPGFYSGQPGMLLEIELLEPLKRHPEFWGDKYLYMFYKKGDFEVAGINFCTTDYRLPPVPAPGARILIFPYTVPFDSEHSLIVPRASEFVYENKNGDLRHALGQDVLTKEHARIGEIKKYILSKAKLGW